MSGSGKNESFDDWLARKAAKKDKSKQVFGRSSGLNRGGSLKRTPLNKVSKKKKKRDAATSEAYKKHYADEYNRKCACCGTSNGLSVHHSEKRLGGKDSDETTFITLCLIGNYMDIAYPESNHSHAGGCHGWVEGNKSLARELGYLK